MKKNAFIVSLLAASFISGCARREEADPELDSASAAQQIVDQQRNAQLEAESQVPEATIAPVTVAISLSQQAQAALSSNGEKISVAATYSGDPKASEQSQNMADTSGMIKLGESTLTLDGAGSVTFDKDVIDQNLLEHTVGEVQFTLNVTSSKTASPQNLLACPFYWETLANASKQTVQIDCTAISEVQ